MHGSRTNSKSPSFEYVWAILQEVAKSHKEYEEERKKDKAEFNERLGKYVNLFGDFTEYMMAPKLREKFKDFGLFFPRTNRNVSVKDENNNTLLETDVPAVSDVFFTPDKKKCVAFLRAQKNVAEQNAIKGRSPDWYLRSLAAVRRRTLTDLLGEVIFAFI